MKTQIHIEIQVQIQTYIPMQKRIRIHIQHTLCYSYVLEARSWLVVLGPVCSGALPIQCDYHQPPRRAVHGATQLVRQQRPAELAMEAALDQPLTPLGSLTKISAQTADFLVRVYFPKKIE